MSLSKQSTFTPSVVRTTKTISITSGKGGVGKTTVVCNMAAQFAKMGKNVLILDGDLGMANVDIMFGARIKHTLNELFNNGKRIDEVLTQVHNNNWLLPGGSGITELQNLSDREKRILLEQL